MEREHLLEEKAYGEGHSSLLKIVRSEKNKLVVDLAKAKERLKDVPILKKEKQILTKQLKTADEKMTILKMEFERVKSQKI
jgi:hypothetical protein